MKKILLWIFSSIFLLLILAYFGVIFTTGLFIEKTLSELDSYINNENKSPKIRLSYTSTDSSLFKRTGFITVRSNLFKESKVPFDSDIGFLKVNAVVNLEECVKNANKLIADDFDSKTVRSEIKADIDVLDFKAQISAALRASYKAKNKKPLCVDIVAKVDAEQKPSLSVYADNYNNSSLINLGKVRFNGNIDGIYPITSLGQGQLIAENIKISSGSTDSISVSYSATECDKDRNFNLNVDASAKNLLGYLSTVDLNAVVSSLNLDKLTGVQESPDKMEYADFVLSDLKKADIRQSDFSVSNKLALKLFKSTLDEARFSANGPLTFSYPDIKSTLSGKLVIDTNSNGKAFSLFMKKGSNGRYTTELVINRGQYILGGIPLGSDFISGDGAQIILEKIPLSEKKQEKVNKALEVLKLLPAIKLK
ncbi:MAG: hypothetical protein ACI4UM_04095 [Succinivibrio sp.]